MKQVTFAKRWINRTNDISYEEYPAGPAVISNDRAERAVAAGVLEGEPVDAPEAPAEGKPKPTKA